MKPFSNTISFLLSFIFLSIASISSAQNLTGIWRGYFITESMDQYKFELQIEQKNTSLSGVSYSYLTTVFYGKATLTGNFSDHSQNALIQEIKTVEVKMGPGSTACIMKCSFQYAKSGKEEFLEGTFTSRFEKDSYGAKKGDNCGSGKVYLRKVQSSDFYIEPFLRNQPDPDISEKKDSISANPKSSAIRKNTVKIPQKPIKKTVASPHPPTNTTAKKPVQKKSVVTKSPAIRKQFNAPVAPITDLPANHGIGERPVTAGKEVPIPMVIKSRENNLVQTIISATQNIGIRIYDNGEIDDDTISVYLDKKLVLSRQRLSASPLVVNFKMEENNDVHEIVMVADNLGRIPPNTSLMIVTAGEKRYEVRITSTEQKNAVVRFVYRKPE